MTDVLLFEDNDVIRECLAELLCNDDLNVRTARGISIAEQVLRDEPSCRVLVADNDLGEFEGSGFEFAGRARAGLPQLGVIYITGQPHSLLSLDLSPRDRTLAKPFRPNELLPMARELLVPSHPGGLLHQG